jgi:hypothetical protein
VSAAVRKSTNSVVKSPIRLADDVIPPSRCSASRSDAYRRRQIRHLLTPLENLVDQPRSPSASATPAPRRGARGVAGMMHPASATEPASSRGGGHLGGSVVSLDAVDRPFSPLVTVPSGVMQIPRLVDALGDDLHLGMAHESAIRPWPPPVRGGWAPAVPSRRAR